MKCVDFDEKLNLLLDDEADATEAQKLKLHLAVCRNCHEEFFLRQRTQKVLRHQPPILPTDSFDNKMLRAFQSHQKTSVQKSIFPSWLNFSNSFLKYGLTTAVLVFGFGLAFLFGRMSVAPINNLTASQIEKIEMQPNKKPVQPSIAETPNNLPTNTETKIITKYIKVPIVKEKIVEKKVYVTKTIKPFPQPQTETFAETKIKEDREKIAEQFNLKELQPVSKVSYKIIRKGENNEE